MAPRGRSNGRAVRLATLPAMPSTATNPAALEREYNARAAIPDHPQIFARWAEQGAMTRRRRAGLIDMPYGDDPGERLDFFPAMQRNSPLLVFIHGGYWRSLDKFDFSWIAPPFLDAGVSVAFLNYGLAPRVPIEEMVRQQLRAIAWLHARAEELGFDPQRIVASGHSAGGHLTAMLMAALWPVFDPALPPDLVKGGVAISGLYDLEPLVPLPFINDGSQARRRHRPRGVAGAPAGRDRRAAGDGGRRPGVERVQAADTPDPRGVAAQCAARRRGRGRESPDRVRRARGCGVDALPRRPRPRPRDLERRAAQSPRPFVASSTFSSALVSSVPQPLLISALSCCATSATAGIAR